MAVQRSLEFFHLMKRTNPREVPKEVDKQLYKTEMTQEQVLPTAAEAKSLCPQEGEL